MSLRLLDNLSQSGFSRPETADIAPETADMAAVFFCLLSCVLLFHREFSVSDFNYTWVWVCNWERLKGYSIKTQKWCYYSILMGCREESALLLRNLALVAILKINPSGFSSVEFMMEHSVLYTAWWWVHYRFHQYWNESNDFLGTCIKPTTHCARQILAVRGYLGSYVYILLHL